MFLSFMKDGHLYESQYFRWLNVISNIKFLNKFKINFLLIKNFLFWSRKFEL